MHNKRLLLVFYFPLIIASLFPILSTYAQNQPTTTQTNNSNMVSSPSDVERGESLTPNPCSNPFTYKTLVDIPGFTEEDGLVTICPSSIGTFLQTIFNYIIGIAILLTVVMIIYGGVQYATVEAVTGKSQAKATIMGALQGLALALGSVLILTTINPDLVKFNLDIGRLNLRTATEGGTGSLVDLGSGLSVVQNEGGGGSSIPITSTPSVYSQVSGSFTQEQLKTHQTNFENSVRQAGLRVISRTAWTNIPPAAASNYKSPGKNVRVILHHTGTGINTPEQILLLHTRPKSQGGRGWTDVAYHFAIGKDGTIYQGRYGGPMVQGAHAGGDDGKYNPGSIGIVLIGNYEYIGGSTRGGANPILETPPAAQLQSVVRVLNYLRAEYSISAREALYYHKEFTGSACAGNQFIPIILKWRASGIGN